MPDSGRGSEASHVDPVKLQKDDLLLFFSSVSEVGRLYVIAPWASNMLAL